MLKVAIYYPELFNRGGCETVIKYIILSLYKEISFSILTSTEDRKEDPDYLEMLNCTSEIISVPYGSQKKITEELGRIKPQVVFTSFFHFATEPCRLLDIPLVEFCVGAQVMPFPQANPLHNYFTVESEGAKKMLLKSRNIGEDRIKVIRNTVFYDGFVADEDEIRQIFSIPSDYSVISLNARAVEGKGWFIIGESMKYLKDEKIFFAGFSRREKSRSKVWDKIINYYNKMENFLVLDGQNVERKYILGLTSLSDLVCYPATHREEGIPNCIVEAIYLGKPVITSCNGYINEIIQNEQNGLFVMPDAKQLAITIKTLIKDRNKMEKFSFNSKNVYNKLYNKENFKLSYSHVFEKASEDKHFYGNLYPVKKWKFW